MRGIAARHVGFCYVYLALRSRKVRNNVALFRELWQCLTCFGRSRRDMKLM